MSPLFAAVRRAALLCLPFAAIFVAGTAFSPSVSAQYPGGGIYPGAGWHPLKPNEILGNDPLNTSPVFYAYDWTKLDDLDLSGTFGKYYAGTEGGIPGIGGMNGGNGGNGSAYYTIYGLSNKPSSQSTIKFQWVPPNDAAGQPDLTDFPAPPLFVLGSITPTVWLNTVATGTANPTGSGWVSDGWGWGPMHIQLPAGQYPSSVSDGVHRKVLTASLASLPSMSTVGTITMAPSGHIEISTPHPTAYGATMGTVDGFLGMPEFAYPITLSAPNPLTNPLLGDGTNQFVYDSTSPAGLLLLPGTIEVTGASADDTAWLMRGDQNSPDVNIVLDLPTETNPIDSSLRDHTICPVVPVDQIKAEHGSLTAPSDGFLYAGLPTHNSDFGGNRTPGYHIEKLTVNGLDSEVAYIQTFFTGVDSNGNFTANYPNAATNKAPDGSVIPNWYYYYNQASPTSEPYEADSQTHQASHIDLSPPYASYLHNDAYHSGTSTLSR